MKKSPFEPFTSLLPRTSRYRRLLAVLIVSCFLGVFAGYATVSTDRPEARAAGDITAPTKSEPLTASRFAPSMTGVWVAMGLFAMMGIAVIFVARSGRRFRPGNGNLHIVDTLSLGGRRMVHLVRCGDRKYLIGNSERGIHYLAAVPPDPGEREVDLDFEGQEGELPFEALLAGGRQR